MPGQPQDRLPDVWFGRDYPILREITNRLDKGERSVNAQQLAPATGLSEDDVQLALRALERRNLIEGMHGDGIIMSVRQVSGAAYLMTGLHPDGDDALTGLIQALRQAADQTSDDEERSNLRKAADALGGVGRDLGVGIMTALVTHYTTGP